MAQETYVPPTLPIDPNQIFDLFCGRVVRFFKSRGYSEDTARDLTQDTFFRVFQHKDELRNQASVETWILRIAANVWKNELRSRGTAKRSGVNVSMEAAREGSPQQFEAVLVASRPRPPNPLETALVKEELAAADRCLDELPPKMRTCLLMHVHLGHKYQEIADDLGLSIESVKSHIHQARQHLKDCVARQLGRGAT